MRDFKVRFTGSDILLVQVKMMSKKLFSAFIILLILTNCHEDVPHDNKFIFYQNNDSISINLPNFDGDVQIAFLNHVPEEIDIHELMGEPLNLSVSENGIHEISFSNEVHDKNYSIILLFDQNYIEFVRQSSVYLKNFFDFDRDGGYTLLGRRSIAVSDGGGETLTKPVFKDYPNNVLFDVERVTEIQEIDEAISLVRHLYENQLYSGPDDNYGDFANLSFREKLSALASGEHSAQCSIFRDLFIQGSHSLPGLKVRALEVDNYGPQIEDLITYGHATAEVWLKDEQRWVLFDPWLGVMMEKDGRFLGAHDLARLQHEPEKINVYPFLQSVTRLFAGSNGHITEYIHEPKDTELTGFQCTELGCQPGYLFYFNYIRVRE